MYAVIIRDELGDFQLHLDAASRGETIRDREGLFKAAENLLAQLEAYVDDLFSSSNMADKAVTKTVQRSLKVIDDVKNSRDNAAFAAPRKPTSSLLAPYVKRCLGFLVIVRDCNALAWADNYLKPYVDDQTDDEDQLWRPKVDKHYPFGTIKSQFVNYTSYSNEGSISVKEVKLTIFARVGKGKVTIPSDDQEKLKAEQVKLKAEQEKKGDEAAAGQDEPTEIGVFRVRNVEDPREDVSRETVCGWYENKDSGVVCSSESPGCKYVPMKFDIPAEGSTLSLDFTKLLEFDLQELRQTKQQKLSDNHDKVKYAVCFIKPTPKRATGEEGTAGDDSSELKDADAKSRSFTKALCSKEDPKLTVVFDDQFEDEDTSDDSSDEDDDESGGSFDFNNYDDDDDDDGKGDEENATGRFEYDSEDELFQVAADGVPLCGQGHRMNFSDLDEGDYAYGWVCNFCSRHSNGNRWVCQPCTDDYCAKCTCKFGPLVRYDNYYGSMTYSECVQYATGQGTRLPTLVEVGQELKRHGEEPLFPQEDMWWPVSDEKDMWVNVGNNTKDVRLGFTTFPEWSEEDKEISQRAVIAYVRPAKEDDNDDEDDDEEEDEKEEEEEGEEKGEVEEGDEKEEEEGEEKEEEEDSTKEDGSIDDQDKQDAEESEVEED